MRYGYIIADNVEFVNVSQKDVGKGGLRFESSIGTTSLLDASWVWIRARVEGLGVWGFEGRGFEV